MKPDVVKRIKKERLYFDGGMGTMLSGILSEGEAPESINLTSPEVIEKIHVSYLRAGADIIKTNTFGVNPLKYENYRDYTECAMEIAKRAVADREGKYIAFDIGPTGRLLSPFGDLPFEEAAESFRKMGEEAERLGADLILVETWTDLYEARAALIGIREASALPVFVTCAFDRSARLMTGASPVAALAVLESLGASAIGINCSFGPLEMRGIVDELLKYSSVPVIVNANAGLPTVKGGVTTFDMNAADFSDAVKVLAESGAHILGGCCGTTPEYIKALVEKTRDIPYKYPTFKKDTIIASYTHAVRIGERPYLIGERINPTGKKRLKEALREADYSYILAEAIREAEAGAHILDVNAGLPEIDESSVLERLVIEIQGVTNLPLQLDSSSPEALERGARIYNGKPLINSVNATREAMDAILPIAKKYGCALIGLTIDEDGIPNTADKRVELALRIIGEAEKYGIPRKDIIIDPLTLTVSTDTEAARVTLAAVRRLHELGIKTSLGVSNVSFGLPARDKLNSAFFSHALASGLDLAIMNPLSDSMMEAYQTYLALFGYDNKLENYIAYFDTGADITEKKSERREVSLSFAIEHGLTEDAARITGEILLTREPLDIINSEIIPALDRIGRDFESGRAYLPRLLASADSAEAAFGVLKEKIEIKKTEKEHGIVLATVKGDIHDIGKNIVKVMLESYGFKVYDLGRDVNAQVIVNEAKARGVSLIGLSALMTTTVANMEECVRLIRSELPYAKVMVGGAVLNEEYAKMIGADFYAPDAMGAVRIAERHFASDVNK